MADDVVFSVHGGVGRITLDRPRAMNALTHAMVRLVSDALEQWRTDDDVRVVLVDGAGERGLCAGGDLKMFHRSALGDGSEARAFFRAEYAMNAQIAGYPKPVVALMFGAVLGGGVGISAHARYRVVHRDAEVGMPEVGIGFVPDVGGTWLLGHAPGELGTYLALTGRSADADGAVLAGLADVVVDDLQPYRDAADAGTLLTLLDAATARPAGDGGALAAQRAWIDECFAAPTAAGIVQRLRASGDPQAVATAELIGTRSPESVVLTLLAVRQARTLASLEDALAVEYLISADSLTRPDLAEGIRAQVIDKDRSPKWHPASLEDVPVEDLARRIASFAADADTRVMDSNTEDTEVEKVPEAPATWENVVVGKAKEALGHVLHDKELEEQGEEQAEAAHEVREEYREER